jgi:hypothetical protein
MMLHSLTANGVRGIDVGQKSLRRQLAVWETHWCFETSDLGKAEYKKFQCIPTTSLVRNDCFGDIDPSTLLSYSWR